MAKELLNLAEIKEGNLLQNSSSIESVNRLKLIRNLKRHQLIGTYWTIS